MPNTGDIAPRTTSRTFGFTLITICASLIGITFLAWPITASWLFYIENQPTSAAIVLGGGLLTWSYLNRR